MESDQEVIGRLAERRCALAMKALLGAAELANAVSAKEFPAEAPEHLCKLLELVATKATQRIAKLSADKPEEAVSQADLLCVLAREIAEHVRYAARAVTLETPWSIVETIAEFGEKLYGSQVSFIVRPKWSYNYSLLGEFRRYYLDKLPSLFPQSDPSRLISDLIHEFPNLAQGVQAPIYAISFPRLEKSDALLHACFAHELGHFVSAEWVAGELPKSGLLDKLTRLLLDYIKQHTKDPVAIASELVDLNKQARIVLERALEELLADVASVLLFGPCVLFAMCHIATKGTLAETPSETNEYYPPWGYRLQEVFSIADEDLLSEAATILEETGFQDASMLVQNYMDEVQQFIGRKEAYLALENWPPAIRYAYQVVDEELPNLEEWIRNKIAGLKYVGQARHLANLCSDIEARIPPLLMQGEREVPTDFRDILNAGWLYLITRVDETINSLTNERAGYRTQRRRLDLLVLKAIESSYLLEHHIPKKPGSVP